MRRRPPISTRTDTLVPYTTLFRSRRAVEDVVVLQGVGLEGENLLQAKAPRVVPGPRQAERLVPRRKLHRARPRRLGQSDRQHLQEDAVDVVLRLLLGEPQRVHLHAVAEAAVLFLRDAVALAAELVPQFGEGAHLAELGDQQTTGRP